MIRRIWEHPRFGSFVRYTATSGLSFVLTFSTALVSREWIGAPPEVAGAVALVVALCFNFFMTRTVVFRSRGSVAGSALRFLATSVVFRLAEYVGYLLLFQLAGLHYLLALLTVTLTSQVLKYFAYRKFVYRQS